MNLDAKNEGRHCSIGYYTIGRHKTHTEITGKELLGIPKKILDINIAGMGVYDLLITEADHVRDCRYLKQNSSNHDN